MIKYVCDLCKKETYPDRYFKKYLVVGHIGNGDNMIFDLCEDCVEKVCDFIDEYTRFNLDGQVQRISAYRSRLKMKKKPFCKYTGIPLTSLREWEKGNKTVSYKCWEKYFKGRA